MDIQLTVVDAPTGRRRDVVLVVEADSTVGDAERALRASLATEGLTPGLSGQLAQLARPAFAPGIWVAGRPVALDTPIRLSPLREGAVVGLGGPVGVGMHDLDVGGVIEVRVVGGPDAGRVHRLPLGEYVIGSAPDARVYIADQSVAARQARLQVSPGELRWTPYERAAAAAVEGRDITGPVLLKPAQVIAIGETRLMLMPAQAPDAALVPTDDGGLAYNRPPRLPPAPKRTTIEMPAEPKDPEKQPIPIIMTIAPLLFGVGLWAVTKNLSFLLFTVLSPLMYVANYISGRRQGKKSHRQQVADYKVAMVETRKRIAEAARTERRLRRHDAPDPATILVTALGPRGRLWERRRGDPDRLLLRLGLARLPSAIEITGAMGSEAPGPPALRDVPVTVELLEIGVFGIAGARPSAVASARWLVAQAATLHSPKDLSIIVLSDERGGADWDWLRWLPHSRPDSREYLSLTGTSPEVTARRIAELANQVNSRVSELAARSQRSMDLGAGSITLLILDGARALRSMPGMPQILKEGPAVGVFAICMDSEERLLPEECGAVASYPAGSPTRLTLRRAYGARLPGVLADQVSTHWSERVARAMAGVRDVSREDSDVALPSSARLLDLLNMEPPAAERVAGLWQRYGRTTEAPIGAAVDGPFIIDMRKDGPHALVAGTTGAGKSELLQSIIASLSARNRPDSMTFVLIDYKGGAAFKDCVDLPHTVGMVTDLDGHLTERALASLNAELKRREHILTLVGAKDIEDYWDTIDRPEFVSPTGRQMDPMPRTVLIIDEFATLKEELGDFVDGLVGIAMRGRSLGVHLILATQRPSGVVSPVIRANTNLRIALRVTDGAESSDVIDAQDAARISKTTPGRGYARTGFSALHAFQTARVGGRRPGGTVAGPPPVLAHPVAWADFAAEIPRPVSEQDDSNMETDLQVLVESIGGAAQLMGIPKYRSPWLPPLSEQLALADLVLPPGSPPPGSPDGRVAAVPFALEDLPDEQAQRPVLFDLEHGSHLVIAGAPRAGRSTALRTLAASIATYTSCRDVHLYALDCGNAALVPLDKLPHTGAVVTRDQVDRADRLISVLIGEITRRQTLLAQYGYGSLAEQRAHVAPEDRLPYLVFLLDRWEGFMASFDDLDGGAMTTNILRMLREGPGVGLRAVIAADRSGLLGKLPTTVEDKLIMRMGDVNDYSLGGLSVRRLPSVFPAGRAFRNDSMIETQLALLDPDPAGPAQVRALAEVARATTERDASVPRALRPARVDQLPARIAVREVLALAAEPLPTAPMWALVGVGGDELRPVGVDLDDDGPGFVIGGPPRSGRSTALLTIANSLLGNGCEIVVVTPRSSPLRRLDGQPGVLGVFTGTATDGEILAALDSALGPAAVLVDDGELLVDEPCAAAFETVLAEGRDAQRALVIAGTTSELVNGYRGYIVAARKGKTGLLLTPEHPMEGDLLGIKPPRSSVGPAPQGRGLLTIRGGYSTIQVPLPPPQ